LQALEQSKLTRYAVKLVLTALTLLILAWPHFRRPASLFISGKEPYHHLITGPVSMVLSFLNHYTGADIVLLSNILPMVLGVLTMLLFYNLLRKYGLDYSLVLISTAALIISPSFIFLFGTLNTYAFTAFIFLLTLNLFTEKREVLGVMMIYLVPFFGPISAILALLLLLVYSLKNERFRLFLAALPSAAILYFAPVGILPAYNNVAISDFGGHYGLGLFTILLSFFGLRQLWEKKYKYLFIYITVVFVGAFFFLDVRVLSYLNFLLAALTALGLVRLAKMEWKSGLIKQLTILVMIYGLIFSGLSYINFTSKDLPNEEVLDMIRHLQTLPGGRVFSEASREYWVEYSGHMFVADQALLHSTKIEDAMMLIESKKVNYLWIDEEMKENIWGGEEKELLFLLEYSKNFKKNKINDYVTLWEVVEE